jgi:tetratricopeptide (TPR) repeat protein
MKKIIILFWMFLSVGTVYGQQAVDYILKARALTEAGKSDQAKSLLSGAINVTRDSRLYTERAEANILEGDYSGAIGDYNEADKISPASGEYGLSRVYALKGDAATSLYHLERNLNSPYK